ncbi:MAG: hypothetical protein IJB96_04170 [Lachnospira sp.]|nr:hypothetical protein [Lachnospira sp.]
MIKKVLKVFCITLIVSILAELIVFNFDAYLSRLGNKPVSLSYTVNLEERKSDGSGYYVVPKNTNVTIYTEDPLASLDYLLIDADCIDEKGNAVPCNVTVSVCDEGNSSFYSLPKTSLFSYFEESKYIRANCYGNVNKLKINIYPEGSDDAYIKFDKIVFNADVPLFFSWLRMLLVWIALCILWSIRPGSSLYTTKFSNSQKKMITLITCMVNILFFVLLICFNTGFYKPGWVHHQQYHKLAVALTEGEVSIVTGFEDVVSSISNPYDTSLRKASMESGYWSVWDLAFYEGKFYVYFGIVPVLLFYLPYYILTGNAFPTNIGIFFMACMALIGIYYLMHQLVRRYFKQIPFLLYLVLSFIVANSIGTIPILMRPDFYSLPIMCAMAFTIWGLALWFSAATLWDAELATATERSAQSLSRIRRKIILRICVGALFMALVAGCRPQFLVGSFFIFFIFGPCIKNSWDSNDGKKQLVLRTIVTALPYVMVAAGIMYYNYIRFGSPFDFGANYNLTTNDMTHRGFNLGRIADGVWMYLFQPPNIGMKFPYVFSTSFNSAYMGTTIREAMFGGAFFTQIITFALLALGKVRAGLKEKKLFGYCITSVIFALIVVIADAQMAGILSRYYYDFLWLLLIPAALVIMQLWEQFKNAEIRKILITFIMVSLVLGMFMNLFIGFQASGINSYNDYIYNFVRYLFS